MEYRRFPEGASEVSTFEFHEHRERAPHLEQHAHRERLLKAAELVRRWKDSQPKTHVRVVDLGCGDGGLVALLNESNDISPYGYDFQPSNADGWVERGIADRCERRSFVDVWAHIKHADLYVLTEVLEHLEDPYEAVRRVAERGAALVCSSPWMEYEGNIDGCHNWAWDQPGYTAMLEACGMKTVTWERVTWSQVHLVVPA